MAPTVTSFFQIIVNSTIQERKLKFPNKFVHNHGKGLHDTVRLSIPTGCCWDVKVRREADGTMWLHDGFLEFMEENSVKIEYFLWFKYEGTSKFIVHIYDLTATEILYNSRRDSERCNVNELRMDETREVRDNNFTNVSNDKDCDNGVDDSCKYKSGDKGTYDSLKNATAYEVSGDDTDDSSSHESDDEDAAAADDDGGDKASDDDDMNICFMSESSDEDGDDDDGDDSLISESSDEDFNNGGVDPPKYDNDGEDSDDSSVECLGSTIDRLSPQLFAEPSEFASKNKKNVDASRKTTRVERSYLTRRKKQIIEGGLESNGSLRSGTGSNSSPRGIAKERTTLAKKIEPMVPNSFRVTLKPYHLANGVLRVPCSFARSYLCSSTAPMKLVDADNKEWEILYMHQRHRENDYFLSRGWRKFVLDKGLVVGDICVFEHIGGNKEVKLKVSII